MDIPGSSVSQRLGLSSAMQPLAVFLTLVILAGSRAAQESSLSQLDKVLSEYFPTVYNETQERWDALRNSKQGQEFSNLLLNSFNTMKSNQAELAVEVRKLGRKLAENVQPHAQELKEKVEVLMGEWQQKFLASWNKAHEGLMEHTQPLRQTLTNMTEELAQKMEQSMEHYLGTSSEALKSKFRKDTQEFRQKLQQQLQVRFRPLRATIQQVTRKLSSYAEAIPSDLLTPFRNIANMGLQILQ
ncbi:uncharacterized protein LOC143837139 [Paroedura picta]|uniref:uncharacterized protein LOC143837139 n=1 Tax=Paroedura picta TaxID=143630 RepID=UPI001014AAF9